MRELLQKTFENAFNETHYKELIRNLFNRFDFSKEHTLRHQFNEAEKQHSMILSISVHLKIHKIKALMS